MTKQNSKIITFGNYNWQVLDDKGDRMLIITKDILELHWYHKEFVEITWAYCKLREYLNNEFYNAFSQEEKANVNCIY